MSLSDDQTSETLQALDIANKVFAAAQNRYQWVLENLRLWIAAPDNEPHELGTPSFALTWVVERALEDAKCTHYKLESCTRRVSSNGFSGEEEVYKIFIFSPKYIASTISNLCQYASELMVEKLELSVELKESHLKILCPHLDVIYPWLEEGVKTRGLKLECEMAAPANCRTYRISCNDTVKDLAKTPHSCSM